MSAYRITCAECSTKVTAWTKAEAETKFRAHVRAEHSEPSERQED